MEELLEQLRYLLNLPVGATANDVKTQLQKLMDQLKSGPAQAAASFDLPAYMSALHGEIATLKATSAQAPDPAKYIDIAVMTAVTTELTSANHALAALKAEQDAAKLNETIAAALAAGKLNPALESWARELGKKDSAALGAYIAAASAPVIPGHTQTGGKPPSGGVDVNDADAISLAALSYQNEQQRLGRHVPTHLAVAHVISPLSGA